MNKFNDGDMVRTNDEYMYEPRSGVVIDPNNGCRFSVTVKGNNDEILLFLEKELDLVDNDSELADELRRLDKRMSVIYDILVSRGYHIYDPIEDVDLRWNASENIEIYKTETRRVDI